MLAIATRYLGPTNHRGSRIVAEVMERQTVGSPKPRRLTLDYADELGTVENHEHAAVALIKKLGWTPENGYGQWVMGSTAVGYVLCCNIRHEGAIVKVE